MFNLHFKDYVFLILIVVGLMIIAGAFLLFSHNNTNQISSSPTEYVCGDIRFSAQIPLKTIRETKYDREQIKATQDVQSQSGLRDLFNNSGLDEIIEWRADDGPLGFRVMCYHTSGTFGSNEAIFSANVYRTIQNLNKFKVAARQISVNSLEYLARAQVQQVDYAVTGRYFLFPNEIVELSALTSDLTQQPTLDAFLQSFKQ